MKSEAVVTNTVRYHAVGRRKCAVASVSLRTGDGKVMVNGRSWEGYFPREAWRLLVFQPFHATKTFGQYDVDARVVGGGLTGQAGALRHGISRALLLASAHLRPLLKKEGFLTRDSRTKERKKFGQKGARKRFQYSKR